MTSTRLATRGTLVDLVSFPVTVRTSYQHLNQRTPRPRGSDRSRARFALRCLSDKGKPDG